MDIPDTQNQMPASGENVDREFTRKQIRELPDNAIAAKEKLERARVGKHVHWTEHEKQGAVYLYCLLGSSYKTSDATGIPAATIRKWKVEPWWEDYARLCHIQIKDRMAAKFSRIALQAAEEIEDRLTYGDYRWTKEGLTRVPVSAKDAMVIAGISTDKRAILRSEPTSITGRADSRLDKLLDRLQKVGEARRGQTLEGEVVKDSPDDLSITYDD